MAKRVRSRHLRDRIATGPHGKPLGRGAPVQLQAGRCVTIRGDYRVIYRIDDQRRRIDDQRRRIDVVAIEHRSDIYRPRQL